MTGDIIQYEELAQAALRGVVRQVLLQVESTGLPGDHHFYIAFDTQSDGVNISKRLKKQYPEEMTVVLHHQFSGLKVTDSYFEVRLSFNNIPERLVVPFSALKVFFDPSVPYGLQFGAAVESANDEGHPVQTLPEIMGQNEDAASFSAPTDPMPQPDEFEGADEDGSSEHSSAEIVELDSFRKK